MKKKFVLTISLFLSCCNVFAMERLALTILDQNRPIQKHRHFHYVAPEELYNFLQAPGNEKTHAYFKNVIRWLHKEHSDFAPDQHNLLLLSLLSIYKSKLELEIFEHNSRPMYIIGNFIEYLLAWIPLDAWFERLTANESRSLESLINEFELYHVPIWLTVKKKHEADLS